MAFSTVCELNVLLKQANGPNTMGRTKDQLRQQQDVMQDAERVLKPMMDFLDYHMTTYDKHCEKSTIQKRLTKKLWTSMVSLFETTCLLPDLPDRNFDYSLKGVQRVLNGDHVRIKSYQTLYFYILRSTIYLDITIE